MQLLKRKDLQEKKHDSSYPKYAIEFVLKYAKLNLKEVDSIVFFEKPFLKFERLLETYVAFAPKGFNLLQKQCLYGLKKNFFKKFVYNKLKRHDKIYTKRKIYIFRNII